MKLNAAELAVILAGLRTIQQQGIPSEVARCFQSEGDLRTLLSDTEIDTLCERLNCETSLDLEEKVAAAYFRQRIEDGDLAPVDLPVRLARYGLMDPEDFIAEMRERIEMAQEEA